MTEPDRALIARLTSDVAAIGAYLARASADLGQLERIVAQRQFADRLPFPGPPPVAWPPPVASAAPAPLPAPTSSPAAPQGWIGKVLAVAGVAVTLVGIALLLVLAAQAGILRPEIRVGAGAVLAAALVGIATRLIRRPGGRVGAIAVGATGIAAAFADVVAVTTTYHWIAPVPGLAVAAVVAVGGLSLSRRWESEHLGLLVLVPLLGVAPVVAEGFSPALLAFMLGLAIASIPAQLGRDWIALHAARVASAALPVVVALAVEPSPALAVAAVLAAATSLLGALLLLPSTSKPTAMALLSAVGTVPVLIASWAADGTIAGLLAAGLTAVLLGIVSAGDRLPMVAGSVRAVFSALAAVSAMTAVLVSFDGPVAGPMLLALGTVCAVAGRGGRVTRGCAVAFGAVGASCCLGYAPITILFTGTTLPAPIAASTLLGSLLVVACAVAIARSWAAEWAWAIAAVVTLYGSTAFAVTSGVLIAGETQGFFAGHVVSTVCWVVLAAGVLRYALVLSKAQRSVSIGGAMAVVTAAMAKLFLFDLGTLDGIFRAVVFLVVGLGLLGMGAAYARLLAQQDDREKAAAAVPGSGRDS